MYKITKQGHPTEATGMHGKSFMRIVVGYDISEDAYRAHVYVRSGPFEKAETRVQMRSTFPDEISALDAGYEAGKAWIDRSNTPAHFQTEVRRDLRSD